MSAADGDDTSAQDGPAVSSCELLRLQSFSLHRMENPICRTNGTRTTTTGCLQEFDLVIRKRHGLIFSTGSETVFSCRQTKQKVLNKKYKKDLLNWMYLFLTELGGDESIHRLHM